MKKEQPTTTYTQLKVIFAVFAIVLVGGVAAYLALSLSPSASEIGSSPNPSSTYDPRNEDSDGDGVLDSEDSDITGPTASPYDPRNEDSDNDGIKDSEDADFPGNNPNPTPFDPCTLDSDGDGVKDCDDANNDPTSKPGQDGAPGTGGNSGGNEDSDFTYNPPTPFDPSNEDSDGDGVTDGNDPIFDPPTDPYNPGNNDDTGGGTGDSGSGGDSEDTDQTCTGPGPMPERGEGEPWSSYNERLQAWFAAQAAYTACLNS